MWECPAYSNNRSVFINSLSLCSDIHLMSAFEKTRYIFDQSIWECNGHFDHWFSNIKDFLCGVWNLHKKRLLSRGFFDEYSFKQLRRETCGQWQKCYGEASMSIYYYLLLYLGQHVQCKSRWATPPVIVTIIYYYQVLMLINFEYISNISKNKGIAII